ncbi:hypothetical protein M0R04_09855 [Candidatus Dojkabacteria bacterium]|jgi:hypothetical protein|nr:hypothetical protein [Candidatus Dojkabacteria bacterium]
MGTLNWEWRLTIALILFVFILYILELSPALTLATFCFGAAVGYMIKQVGQEWDK